MTTLIMKADIKTLIRNTCRVAYRKVDGHSPCMIFCGGFNSNMQGIKALAIEQYCHDRGQAFIRFDYFAHGQSEGDFAKGSISRWLADTLAIIDRVAKGNVVLVGSSMGGWIALLAALQRPERVKGLLLLACAVDMTRYFSERVQNLLQEVDSQGREFYSISNEYDDQVPYKVYAHLLQDGKQYFLLNKPIHLTIPVHLIHGKLDEVVPWKRSQEIADLIKGAKLHLIDQGDHRLSRNQDIKLLFTILDSLLR